MSNYLLQRYNFFDKFNKLKKQLLAGLALTAKVFTVLLHLLDKITTFTEK
jgi:hypothetical protein